MNILKALLLYSLFTITPNANGEMLGEFKGCGSYFLRGDIQEDKNWALAIVINAKTNSEHRFRPAKNELIKFAGFLNSHVEMKAKILKFDGTIGEISQPQEIKRAIHNPLVPLENSGFKLIKEEKCI